MKYLNYLKKYKFIILPILVCSIIVFSNLLKTEAVEENILEDEQINQNDIVEDTIKFIKVDVKGAVKKPGVYELESNSRVSDAINLSGGLASNADTSLINLSKILKDEMVIIVYTKKEVENMKKEEVKTIYVEKECNCPVQENNACIESDDLKFDMDNITTSKVSLNTATIEQLMTISGIGESKAKSIIEYREKNGYFKTIEEVKNVSGIGESLYEKIKDSITI